MKSEIHNISNLGTLIRLQKGRFSVSILLAVLGVIGRTIPYFAIAKIITNIFTNDLTLRNSILGVGIAFVGYLSEILCSNLSTAFSHKAAYLILKNLRLSIAQKLPRVSMGNIQSQTDGYYKEIMVDKIEGLEVVMAHMVPELTANICVPVFLFILLFLMDWRMALVSISTLLIGMIVMIRGLNGYSEKFQGQVKTNRHMIDTLIEYVKGIEVIRVFNQGETSYQKYEQSVKANAEYSIDWMKGLQKVSSAFTAIVPTVLLTVLPLGYLLYSLNQLGAEQFLICIIISLGIVSPILAVFGFTDSIAGLKTTLNDIDSILSQPELIRPKEDTKLKNLNLYLQDVSFSYQKEKETIHNLSMEIPYGKKVAIVGPSGSGKSTIAKLIAGFWDVSSGAISIGGTNIKEIPLHQWNELISFVSQDNFLFDLSIRENIRIGKPTASDQEVENAAAQSGCDLFIRNLEHGYDTVVGNAGGKLSGGERQRITIARAILKNAPIIIFDEATAFTDVENEAIIQAAIAVLMKGKTQITIAHRLSTIIDSDKIFVIDAGNLVASGTQQELMESCLLYQKMWKAHIEARDN